MESEWYHGGPKGLTRILPPSKTGAASCASYGAKGICRTDKVYLTRSVEEAALFAALNPFDGVIYGVKPIGEISDDPDYRGESGSCIQCDEAEIISVIKLDGKTKKRIQKAILGRSI